SILAPILGFEISKSYSSRTRFEQRSLECRLELSPGFPKLSQRPHSRGWPDAEPLLRKPGRHHGSTVPDRVSRCRKSAWACPVLLRSSYHSLECRFRRLIPPFQILLL